MSESIQGSLSLGSSTFSHDHTDVVFTPEKIAVSIINHFKPTGKIVDPCKGDGVFYRNMRDAEYCELQEGIDFFSWTEKVDWLVSNPPYSVYSQWIRHSFSVADNIVYLIPINKAFNSSSMLKATYEYGGIKEILHIGPGSSLNFPVGFAIGAVYYKRNYGGHIRYSDLKTMETE